MGKGTRYNDEFKQEAVNQVVLHGYSVADVSQRLGISNKSLYDWIKIFSKPKRQRDDEADLRTENARLKRELKRAQEERDILKEAARYFAGESKSATRS
jgi:transposase